MFSRVFSETVASRMHINTRGLSHHEVGPSRKSSPGTLSFTNVILKNTDNDLA